MQIYFQHIWDNKIEFVKNTRGSFLSQCEFLAVLLNNNWDAEAVVRCCWSEPEVGLSSRNWPKVALSGRNWFLQRMQLRGWQTECYLLHQVEPIFTSSYSCLYLLSHLIYVFVTCYFLWCMFVFAIFNVGEISSDLYRYHIVTF